MSKLSPWVVGATLLAWTAVVGPEAWVNAHRLAESPENESVLYQRYDPEQLITRFRYERESYSGGHSYGATHLVRSIHHSQSFTPSFTMQANREHELLRALREDVMLRLRAAGMTVVAANGERDGGVAYSYISGDSIGTISIALPVHKMTVRRYPTPGGLDDVVLRIDLDETWTRPQSETKWWMAAVD